MELLLERPKVENFEAVLILMLPFSLASDGILPAIDA
jgi:hypothetical protein